MSKAQIEGSMQLPDESDSSESEEEVEIFVENQVPKVAEKAPVFAASAHVTKGTPGGLLGAMTAAVQAIEGGSGEAEAEVDSEPVPDSFGIVYKPVKRKTENPNVRAMSFEDEKEFEHELKLAGGVPAPVSPPAASAVPTEDDDEFDLDMAGGGDSSTPALSDILSRVANQSEEAPADGVEVVDEAPAAAKTEAETAVDYNSAVWESTDPAKVHKPEEVSGASILQSSRSALADVRSAYSGGRGDLEVRLLDAASQPGASEVIPLHALKDMGAIEEGDEEEEEEEEQREEQQKEEELRQEERLEAQWGGVNEPGAQPPSTLEDEFDAAVANIPTSSNTPTASAFVPLSYAECLAHLMDHSNLAQYESIITVEDAPSSGFGSLFGGNAKLAFTPCKSKEDGGACVGVSREAQRLPFLLAQVDYDPTVEAHYRALGSIYCALCPPTSSGAVVAPPTTSPLWEDIGFQGMDPRTDVNRAMKMFAVLQILHLLETFPRLARQCHAISESYVPGRTASSASLRADPTKDVSWPFMCVSIMFTRETVQAFRSGVLNAKCNKHGQVLDILHDFHHALFQQFLRYADVICCMLWFTSHCG